MCFENIFYFFLSLGQSWDWSSHGFCHIPVFGVRYRKQANLLNPSYDRGVLDKLLGVIL